MFIQTIHAMVCHTIDNCKIYHLQQILMNVLRGHLVVMVNVIISLVAITAVVLMDIC